MNSLTNLYDFGSKLLDIESLESVYETFVSEAAKFVGAQYGSIFLHEDEGLKRVYASAKELYSIIPRKNGLTAKNLQGVIPTVSDAKYSQAVIRKMKIKSIIMIPLIYKRKSIGILTLLSKKKESFSQKELRMLQLIGVVASSAIIKARLAQELQAAVQSRDLFIAMASHELKTPLTAITVYSQILRKKVESGIAPKQVVTDLAEEVVKFNRLVSGLLQLNTVQSGKLGYSFEKCFLEDIVSNAAKTFRTCFPAQKLIFNNKDLKKCMVYGDHEKLTEVFTNLLNNAGKFSPAKSKITLSVARKKHMVDISITNQGPGINKKDRPFIFTKFYRGDGPQPGLGLGLFLVKTIIEEHSGNISFTTSSQKGTTFTVRLPLLSYD